MLTGQTGAFSWEHVLARLRTALARDYEFLHELGRGGFASVHLARDLALNRRVAVKVMSPSVLMAPGMMERAQQEAVTHANLTHPNIVPVFQQRVVEDLFLVIMQYVPGKSLQQVVKGEAAAGRPLPLDVIRAVLFQVGSALAYAHRRGVVHRDVKPGNILLSADGDAIVTDFGIAKVSESAGHTQTGTVIGTAQYMSPEQCYAAKVTGASDQYSLGIVAYELLTGAPPFTGNSFMVMQAQTLHHPAPPSHVRPDCPPDVEAAVLRMLAKEPEERFPSIPEALAALGAQQAPTLETDPIRSALIRLAAVDEVEQALRGDDPWSPVPAVRTPADAARSSGEGRMLTDAPVRVDLQSPPASLITGEQVALQVAVYGGSGSLITDTPVTWRSSDPQVLAVDAGRGVATALKPGRAAVTASAGSATTSAVLDVLPLPNAVSVPAPPQAPVVAVPLEPVPAPSAVPVATPLPAGTGSGRAAVPRLIGIAVGALAVVVAGGLYFTREGPTPGPDTADVVIPPPPPPPESAKGGGGPQTAQRIELATVAPLLVGQRRQVAVTIEGLPADAPRRWTSSDPAVLTVDSAGLVRAIRPGTAQVSLQIDTIFGGIDVTVLRANDPPPTRLDVQPSRLELSVGEHGTIRSSLTGATGPVAWRSTQPDVATVDGTGRVSAVAPGTARIVATAGSLSSEASVRVLAPPPARVVVTGARTLDVGATVTFTARAEDSRGSAVAGQRVQWSSTNPGVATVDANGRVHAVAAGATEIRAALGEVYGAHPVTVAASGPPPGGGGTNPPPPAALTAELAAPLAAACAEALRAGSAQITARFDESSARQQLLDLLGRPGAEVTSRPGSATVDGARIEFPAEVRARNAAGRSMTQRLTVVANARQTNGSWTLVGCLLR